MEIKKVFCIPNDLNYKLRLAAVKLGKKQKEILKEALEAYLNKQEGKK